MSSPGDNRDAGFCSGEDEDLDVDVDHVDTDADNSPTDVSEDSVDVKVHAITGIGHKRKHTPSRRTEGHAKKPCTQDTKSRSPFRPWSHEACPRPIPITPQPQVIPCGYKPQNCCPTEQDEPLSLVVKHTLKREDRIYKPKYAGKLGAFRNASPEPSTVPKSEPDSGAPSSPGHSFGKSPEPVRIVPKVEPVFSSPLLRAPEFGRIVPKTESARIPSDVRCLSLSQSTQIRPSGSQRSVPKTEPIPGFSNIRDFSLNKSSPSGPPVFCGLVSKMQSFPISSDVGSLSLNQPSQIRPSGSGEIVPKMEPIPGFSDVRNLSLNQISGIAPKTESIPGCGNHVRDHSLNQSSQIGPPKLRIKLEKRDDEHQSHEEIRHLNPAYRGIPVKQELEVDSRHESNHRYDPHELAAGQLESRQLEFRQQESRQQELRQLESRQLELRQLDSRQLESNQQELRQLESRQLELRQLESRQLELRQLEPRQLESTQQELRQLESRQLELRQSMPSTSPKSKKTCKSSQLQQRNYKNMTRERRMEANARERTRVHTISAAFETLRHTVPAYSHNQKLSKLSVLRIACSYIMTLSRLAGLDYSADQSEPSIASCVDNVSKTIQMEGKLRKKKDEH